MVHHRGFPTHTSVSVSAMVLYIVRGVKLPTRVVWKILHLQHHLLPEETWWRFGALRDNTPNEGCSSDEVELTIPFISSPFEEEFEKHTGSTKFRVWLSGCSFCHGEECVVGVLLKELREIPGGMGVRRYSYSLKNANQRDVEWLLPSFLSFCGLEEISVDNYAVEVYDW